MSRDYDGNPSKNKEKRGWLLCLPVVFITL